MGQLKEGVDRDWAAASVRYEWKNRWLSCGKRRKMAGRRQAEKHFVGSL